MAGVPVELWPWVGALLSMVATTACVLLITRLMR